MRRQQRRKGFPLAGGGLETFGHAATVAHSTLAAKTLAWFDRHRRELPWRATPGETADPYRVWLSEILLQQTTTAGAAPYYREFLRRWPDVAALAAAPIDEVMSAFAGLGYYSRARNLHACAKAVAAAGGAFPSDEAALRALPGVGPYTAAAVAAIAFDRPATPVDGNIARIVSRLAGFSTPIAANRRAIEAFARTMTPARRAGDFAQALMDIGATICRPEGAGLPGLSAREDCRAAASGDPEAYPGRAAKKPRPEKVGAAFFAVRPNGAFLARRRPPKGLLGGTMELPGGPWRPAISPTSAPRTRRSPRAGRACRNRSSMSSPISRCASQCSAPPRRTLRARRHGVRCAGRDRRRRLLRPDAQGGAGGAGRVGRRRRLKPAAFERRRPCRRDLKIALFARQRDLEIASTRSLQTCAVRFRQWLQMREKALTSAPSSAPAASSTRCARTFAPAPRPGCRGQASARRGG